ncbi:hypothetical protein [Bradyrhizobium sp. Ai1a-2]|uniref:hypothetical protein n=1 Tax=Bradyrhizobium sp. Ai1a-2 TaxID=196490 RepID=UPI0004026B3A|nr:hypothetical protein [Bradyrhizobium sp. Ai1a-2]
MKKLAIAFAVSAATLIGGSAANAADRPSEKTGSYQSQSTDISARGRGYHHYHYGMHRHYPRYGYRHYGYHRHGYRPYYNSYGYQRPYYGGGPGVTFSFGSGGYRGW